jgi:Fe-S cluster biogenesis protein NfuA/nitrite reductase/ring-hydroxylating ferredoxin subunit
MSSATTSAPAEATGEVRSGLDGFLRDIERFEAIVGGWDDSHQAAVTAYRGALEALHKEAFRRLIAGIKGEPAALAAMRHAASDEVVYAVLRHLELVKPSLHERVEQALARVRPMLASHGGDIELVTVQPPDAIQVRFLGACDGCPASTLTFIAGVKKAIEESCPEITRIDQVKGLMNGGDKDGVRFVSPFAINQQGSWRFAAKLGAVPEGGVLTLALENNRSVLLSRNGAVVACFENACAHLGMELDMGEIEDGILTCPYHGFKYDLRSGECLTAPEVQLQAHAVRVVGDRVEVRLSS